MKETLYACGYLFAFIFILAMLLLFVGRVMWWVIDLVYTFTSWLLA